MPIRVICACGKRLSAPDEFRGRRGRCPNCSRLIVIPLKDDEIPSLTAVSEEEGSFSKNVSSVPSNIVKAPSGEQNQYGAYTPEQLFTNLVATVVGIEGSSGAGSGVVIDSDGVVATNRHVTGCDKLVNISFSDGRQCSGKLLRSYRDIDLAFLRTDLTSLSAAEFSAKPIRVGQPVCVIGHPFGFQNTLTRGVISGLDRMIEGARYIQTDAPINPGNSGGPLFNEFGQLVGISTMVWAQADGIGFAVPSDVILERYQTIAGQLRGGAESYYCGICGKDSPNAKYCDVCGAVLDSQQQPSVAKTDSLAKGSQGVICRACRNTTAATDKFCPSCGATL